MCKEVGNAKDRYAISIWWGPDVVAYLPQRFIELTQRDISHDTSLSHDKYHTDLISNSTGIIKFTWYKPTIHTP